MSEAPLDSYTAGMPSKRFFKPKAPFLRRLLQSRRFPPQTISTILLALGWAMICATLAILPRLWVNGRMTQAAQAMFDQGHQTGHQVVDHWAKAMALPDFRRGDEADLRETLDGDPLVRALVDLDHDAVWIREQNRMVRVHDPQEAALLKGWARDARASGKPHWLPLSDPKALEESSLVLPSGRFWEVKTWRPGSPEVEHFLRPILGLHSKVRFGIIHWNKGVKEEYGVPPAPRPTPPPDSLQTNGERAWANYQCLGALFGVAWSAGIAPTPEEEARLTLMKLRWTRLAWTLYGLTVVLSGLGLMLYLHARHREHLKADRLAALAHSLKTPLAILKLRCDTARNVNLPGAQREAYLSSIGDEVDQLVEVIEAGLESIRPKLSRPALDHISQEFFDRLEEDLRAAFEDAERDMGLQVRTPTFLANEQALHAALSTLLENALMHGHGAVELRVERRNNLVAIQVRDHGPGVDLDRLDDILGGSRLVRPPQKATGSYRSQGLGLFLLAQLAEREGWGLLFQSEPGVGFSAVVEIRQ